MFLLGIFLHRYLSDEFSTFSLFRFFAFSLVSPPGSIATQAIAVTFLQSGVALYGTCGVLLSRFRAFLV